MSSESIYINRDIRSSKNFDELCNKLANKPKDKKYAICSKKNYLKLNKLLNDYTNNESHHICKSIGIYGLLIKQK